ncbi:MAG: hypothetical protein ACYTFQ_14725, partial [Planctomycetota bacterium]
HRQEKAGAIVQTSAEHDKRQPFFLDTQPQPQPAELIHTGLGTGKKARHYDKKRKRQYQCYVIAH